MPRDETFNTLSTKVIHTKANYLVIVGNQSMGTISTSTNIPIKFGRGAEIVQKRRRGKNSGVGLDPFSGIMIAGYLLLFSSGIKVFVATAILHIILLKNNQITMGKVSLKLVFFPTEMSRLF
jgi:hypothetical protein